MIIDYHKIRNIHSIRIQDKYPSCEYTFTEKYKVKNGLFKKATHKYNVYKYSYSLDLFNSDESYKTEKDLLNDKNVYGENKYIIIDNVLYNRASVTIKFLRNESLVKLFDTIDEAQMWVENFLIEYKLDKDIVNF